MSPFLNNRERDQLFLEACYQEDRAALDRWIVESYQTEVAQAMKAAADEMAPVRLSSALVINLVVECTSVIYRDHAKLPSRFHTLKARVRNFAFAYMVQYLRERRRHQQL